MVKTNGMLVEMGESPFFKWCGFRISSICSACRGNKPLTKHPITSFSTNHPLSWLLLGWIHYKKSHWFPSHVTSNVKFVVISHHTIQIYLVSSMWPVKDVATWKSSLPATPCNPCGRFHRFKPLSSGSESDIEEPGVYNAAIERIIYGTQTLNGAGLVTYKTG